MHRVAAAHVGGRGVGGDGLQRTGNRGGGSAAVMSAARRLSMADGVEHGSAGTWAGRGRGGADGSSVIKAGTC